MSLSTTTSAQALFALSLCSKPVTSRSPAEQLFYSIYFNYAIREVEFDNEWNNGTGYYDGVCADEALAASLEQGEIVKFKSGNARPGLIVMTTEGPLVFFQRYTDAGPIVYNAPSALFRRKANDARVFITEEEADSTLPTSSSGVARLFLLQEALVNKSLSRTVQ